MTILYIAIAVAALAAVYFFVIRKKSSGTKSGLCSGNIPAESGTCVEDSKDDILRALSETAGIPKERADFQVFGTTPGGMRYRSPVPVPAEFLAAADRGVQRTIDKYKAVFPYWKRYLNISDYDVVMPTANFVGDINPSTIGAPILTYGGGYTAGTSIGTDPKPPVKKMYLVIPHQSYSDDTHTGTPVRVECNWQWLEFWENTFANEAEHQIERANDYNLFLRFTGWDDVHPHVIP